MGIRDILRRAKILPSPVTRCESLLSGFSFAYVIRFSDYPFESIVELNESALSGEALGRHRIRVNQLTESIGLKTNQKGIGIDQYRDTRAALLRITPAHEAWFCAGFFLFHLTAQLGFDLVALDDEEARAILTRPDVRKTTANFIGALGACPRIDNERLAVTKF